MDKKWGLNPEVSKYNVNTRCEKILLEVGQKVMDIGQSGQQWGHTRDKI